MGRWVPIAATLFAGCQSGHAGVPRSWPRVAAHGVSIALPGGWRYTDRDLTPHVSDPKQVLAVGTYPLRYAPGRRCAQVPERAVRELGPGDVLITLRERARGHYPPRRRPFRTGPRIDTDYAACVGRHDIEEHQVEFSDRGRSFIAYVGFGRAVSSARRATAIRVLDSLRVQG
jgi:hypothetical protein